MLDRRVEGMDRRLISCSHGLGESSWGFKGAWDSGRALTIQDWCSEMAAVCGRRYGAEVGPRSIFHIVM